MIEATKESFLRMIEEEPGEDDVRLVYADYLMEQGDHRGEFIAIQYALDRVEQAEMVDNERREKLLDANVNIWKENWLRFVREDFLDYLTDDQIKFLGFANPNEFCFGYEKGFLSELFFSKIQIGREGTKILSQLKCLNNLNVLDLGRNNIGDEGARYISESKYTANIKRLYLECNKISDKGVRYLSESRYLSNLEDLGLWGNEISSEGVYHLFQSKYLANLKYLCLYDNKIGNDVVRWLSSSNCLGNLEVLDLRLNYISPDASSRLKSSEFSKNCDIVTWTNG